MTETPKHLPRHVMLALAGPSIPLAALSLPLVVYLPAYYSGTLGLDLAMVGTVFMVVRLLDIGFDPFIGGVMDRMKTRFGRYRPWLAIAAPIIMLSMGMLFMARPGVGPLYLTGWLLMAYAGWSIMTLAQLALAANVSPDYHERSRIYGWWQIAFSIGMIGAMLMPKLVGMAGITGQAASMAAMAWLVIVLAPVMVSITLALVRERPVVAERQGGGLRDYFEMMRNRTVQRLLACEALLGITGGATSTLALFYFTRTKGLDAADLGLLFIVHAIAGMALTPLWSRLAIAIGKHHALAVAALVYAAGQVAIWAVPAGQLVLLLLAQGIVGIAYGGSSLLPRAMIADVSDKERLRTRQERTGLLYALLIGVWKIGQAVSVGLMFWALSLFAFNPAPGATNAASAMMGLQILYIGLPILLCCAAAWVAFRYPLTAARHAEIRLELERIDASPVSA
ncbi:MFS transporter [Sphingomonas koreensis]|uniref:MFS transporter n=1 Tax=Sphingomonas koreensis TaxID=93064 RepID=A0A430G7V8_9SPHN|nr:MFS transporter [Sphingomonas koreensis]PKP93885.1 MAG: MFS transporter [Alphaproteobacteria bacterium HGW-Alphaproteobacteria-16]PZU59925.1 MAG: MFS transporter [Sphingobium sp.]RSY89494.1 MFS transporter [Sphingomonas koreensis]